MIHVKQRDRHTRDNVSRETFLTPEIAVPNKRHYEDFDDARQNI
jgi:hypothetical protein